jgi:hypothetical protein
MVPCLYLLGSVLILLREFESISLLNIESGSFSLRPYINDISGETYWPPGV